MLERTSSSSRSLINILRDLAKETDEVPTYTQFMRWLDADAEIRDQYAKAKEAQCDFLADEIMEIADDSSLDMAFTEEGKPFIDREHINRSRLRVDTRKWILSKIKPKKYGEHLNIDAKTDNKITIEGINALTDEELETIARSRSK